MIVPFWFKQDSWPLISNPPCSGHPWIHTAKGTKFSLMYLWLLFCSWHLHQYVIIGWGREHLLQIFLYSKPSQFWMETGSKWWVKWSHFGNKDDLSAKNAICTRGGRAQHIKIWNSVGLTSSKIIHQNWGNLQRSPLTHQEHPTFPILYPTFHPDSFFHCESSIHSSKRKLATGVYFLHLSKRRGNWGLMYIFKFI